MGNLCKNVFCGSSFTQTTQIDAFLCMTVNFYSSIFYLQIHLSNLFNKFNKVNSSYCYIAVSHLYS